MRVGPVQMCQGSSCLQFPPAAGWDWGISFFCHCFWLWLFSCDLPWVRCFDLPVYIIGFKIWWKHVLMMGVFLKLIVMFDLFYHSANPTTFEDHTICTGVKLWDKTMWRQIPPAFSSHCLQWYRTKLNWGRISYMCSSCKASDPSLLLSIVSYCWL